MNKGNLRLRFVAGRSTIWSMMLRALLTSSTTFAALMLATTPALAQRRGPGPFAGSFSLESNTAVSITSPITLTESRSTRERAEIRPGSRGDLAIHVTNERGERCVLEGNLSGASNVTLLGGQRCSMTDPVREIRMNMTLRSGSGSINGDRLSLSVSWSVETAGGLLSASGTASQRVSGTRTGGGPAVAAVPQPVPGVEPVPTFGTPQPAVPLLGAPSTPTPTRGRRGRRRGEALAVPVATPTPTPAVAPASGTSPSNEAPIWGIQFDGNTVSVSLGSPSPSSAPTPIAPAQTTPAPAPSPAPSEPPVWGASTTASTPSSGGALGAPTTASPMGSLGAPTPSTGGHRAPVPTAPGAPSTAPMGSLGAPVPAAPGVPSTAPMGSLGAAVPATAPVAGGSTAPRPMGSPNGAWSAAPPAPTGQWGAAPQPVGPGTPLVSFGGAPGAPGAMPPGGMGVPGPYGYPQPGTQPSPYGYPQPGVQPTPYGYPQPGAQPSPYGYPQPSPYNYPQGAPAPMVQFGTQPRAPLQPQPAWVPGAGAPQPAPAPAPVPVQPAPQGPRALVTFGAHVSATL